MTAPKPSGEEMKFFAEKEIKNRQERALQEHSAEELDHIREGLTKKLAVDDEQILEYLLALGFTGDTVGVLPLIPLIQVAWADGEIQSGEHRELLKIASKKGVKEDSEAYKLLDGLLLERPTDEFMYSCLFVLREIYELLPGNESEKAKLNLMGFAEVIAKASGGFLGLFGDKVSSEERDLIGEMARRLGAVDSNSAQDVHRSLTDEDSEDEDEDEDKD